MSKATPKSKNDLAWENLFTRHDILQYIQKQGFFEIKSTEINEERESRLMAKFDHKANLPWIFKKNNLSILPLSRSSYIIGHFQTHFPVHYNPKAQTINVSFPEYIESIDYTNLNSESIAINCAFNSGIINDLVDYFNEFYLSSEFTQLNDFKNDEVYYAVSGRMSTGNFSFTIVNTETNEDYSIDVTNSQCEIDAGFETKDYFLIIEAKNYEVDDFLVRQLYYPYRLWSEKVNKKIFPILMTYSNSTGVFSFFIYNFKDNLNYNSIDLVVQRNYKIDPENITRQEVDRVYESVKIKTTLPNISFPQADNFRRIIDLVSILKEKSLTKEEITINYQFDARQTNYYTDAARYLGLVDKYLNTTTRDVTFKLTIEGECVVELGYKRKILYFIRKILENEVFYKTYKETLENGKIPSKQEICQIMNSCELNLSQSTTERRSSTVRAWIEWILQVVE